MSGTCQPTGTVTFVFTDIEEGSKLWEEFPDAMRQATSVQDAILRQHFQAFQGSIFKTVGDAFCVAFPTATQAVESVFAAQCTLCKEDWPPQTHLKIRMAVHTGEVEHRDNDYFGPPLNRVARILATCHGGQILVSGVTQELVRDRLPSAASLIDLGEHRLKDLWRTERIFQLVGPDLPSKFPAIKSLNHPSVSHNLPHQPTNFVGREKQVIEIEEKLLSVRLLTLTGPGGTGKTRLGLQVAANMTEDAIDGAWFIELASVTNPSLVAQAVASTLSIPISGEKTIEESIIENLQSRRILLLFDNCEHLIDSVAQMVDRILKQCVDVKVLATSRENLGVPGEAIYQIPSLTLPDLKQKLPLEVMTQFEAVRLFIDRAEQAKSDFTVTSQNVPAIASICHRLDGIPLAIELAAARVRTLTVAVINEKLDQRFRLLTGGSRTWLPRQQTLRSLIDWSYDLLSEVEKLLLCRLSVFNGGWTLESCEAICAGEPIEGWEILDLIASLVDKSLVAIVVRNGTARYQLLETVRAYASDRLSELGGTEQWKDRHLDSFVVFAEQAEAHLTSPNQTEWLDHLEAEHDNIRSALEWSRSSSRCDRQLRLTASLWRFWLTRGYLTEGREQLRVALKNDSKEDATIRLKALIGAGNLARLQHDFQEASELITESLMLSRQQNQTSNIAISLSILGLMAWNQGKLSEALPLLEESLMSYREINDLRGVAATLNNLGMVTWSSGNSESSYQLFQESLTLRRQLRDRVGEAMSLINLGEVSYELGKFQEALTLYQTSLNIQAEIGDRRGLVESLEGLAQIAIALGLPLEAAKMFGAEERFRQESGVPLAPNRIEHHNNLLLLAQGELSDAALFRSAWEEGRVMSIEDILIAAATLPSKVS